MASNNGNGSGNGGIPRWIFSGIAIILLYLLWEMLF